MLDDIKKCLKRSSQTLWRDCLGMSALISLFFVLLHAPVPA